MLHDEPSETAQQWLENVRREKRRQSLYSDIPYIDDVDIPDSALDVPESGIRFRDDGTDKKPPETKHEEDAEVDGLAGNFLVNFFGQLPPPKNRPCPPNLPHPQTPSDEV